MNRAKLRENTFKLLYCNEFHDKSEMPKQYELFWDNMEHINSEEDGQSSEYKGFVSERDREYISDRVGKVAEKVSEIDDAINGVAVGWTTERMSKVDLAILRLAYYEMKIDDEIPEKVAVDQAVELAKKYGSDDSPAFINGILAKLF